MPKPIGGPMKKCPECKSPKIRIAQVKYGAFLWKCIAGHEWIENHVSVAEIDLCRRSQRWLNVEDYRAS